ncbi:hypothetical protein B0H16DRAFT_1488184 [Mycena metata]|uniref:Uncharacterized protein n=1 Tax=Mycena metata TaxID=1033252 RepID=A0AAD7KIS9_9AGAR|nr:hypothetical protein B0H16DRAFT_1488184 [Mycena metata]
MTTDSEGSNCTRSIMGYDWPVPDNLSDDFAMDDWPLRAPKHWSKSAASVSSVVYSVKVREDPPDLREILGFYSWIYDASEGANQEVDAGTEGWLDLAAPPGKRQGGMPLDPADGRGEWQMRGQFCRFTGVDGDSCRFTGMELSFLNHYKEHGWLFSGRNLHYEDFSPTMLAFMQERAKRRPQPRRFDEMKFFIQVVDVLDDNGYPFVQFTFTPELFEPRVVYIGKKQPDEQNLEGLTDGERQRLGIFVSDQEIERAALALQNPEAGPSSVTDIIPELIPCWLESIAAAATGEELSLEPLLDAAAARPTGGYKIKQKADYLPGELPLWPDSSAWALCNKPKANDPVPGGAPEFRASSLERIDGLDADRDAGRYVGPKSESIRTKPTNLELALGIDPQKRRKRRQRQRKAVDAPETAQSSSRRQRASSLELPLNANPEDVTRKRKRDDDSPARVQPSSRRRRASSLELLLNAEPGGRTDEGKQKALNDPQSAQSSSRDPPTSSLRRIVNESGGMKDKGK